MITQHDREMLRYIEDVGFCTAQQLARIFYRESKQGEGIARRRLKRMIEAGYLKVNKIDNRYDNRNLYTFKHNDGKVIKPSMHRILLYDYHALLINVGAEIQYFKVEQQWMNGEVRSDGFCIYTVNSKPYYDLIEVVASNNVQNIYKYNKVYDSGEIQGITPVFPRIVVISDQKVSSSKLYKDIRLIHLDYNLNPIASLFQ